MSYERLTVKSADFHVFACRQLNLLEYSMAWGRSHPHTLIINFRN
ncbi:MAG: hypothetical protein ACM37W_02195 [Actinomycetota bacterium]